MGPNVFTSIVRADRMTEATASDPVRASGSARRLTASSELETGKFSSDFSQNSVHLET